MRWMLKNTQQYTCIVIYCTYIHYKILCYINVEANVTTKLIFFLIFLSPLFPAKLPFGIDVHHGVGTACEGWIKIPKPGGVRRGWQRAYAIVCDFKVFLHEPSNDIHTPSVSASHIFDIRSVCL